VPTRRSVRVEVLGPGPGTGPEKAFNNLDGYAEEFFAFLDGNTRFFPEAVQNDGFLAAVQRAAVELVFSVVDDTNKLKEEANIARLEAAIAAKAKALDAIAFPKRITADHEQRAIGKHADAIAEKLADFFELLPQDLRKTLAALSIREVFKRPAELFSSAGLVFAGFGDHDIFPHMIEYRSAGMLEGTQVIDVIHVRQSIMTCPRH
jgi:hypothetical protein